MTISPNSDAIRSLQDIKLRHSLMLRANSEGRSGGAQLPTEEIISFLAVSSRAGQFLASETSRDSAQGILDYWTSQLLSRDPSIAPQLGGYFLQDYIGAEASSDDISEQEASARELAEIVRKAKNFPPTSNPVESKALRLVLLALFKLSPGSRTPISTPLPASDSLLQQAQVPSTIDALIVAGLVRKDGEGPSSGYTLTRNELLIEWPLLSALAEERRGFRDIASGWDKGGRMSAALLNRGNQLHRAEDYRDISKLEQDFLDASLALKMKLSNFRKNILYLALVLVSLIIFWLVYLNRQLGQKVGELNVAKNDLIKKVDELMKAQEESNQNLARAQSYYSQIHSIADQVDASIFVPLDVRDILDRANDVSSELPTTSNKMVEILVSRDVVGSVEAAEKYANSLIAVGFTIPSNAPLARAKVADRTEVRYYYEEDKNLAEEAKTALVKAGIKGKIPILKWENDTSAPKRFIQISIAKSAL
jgi:hypothetical protein